MEPFYPSILPDPLSLSPLTSSPLRRKMIKGRAEISLSSRGVKGHTHPREQAREFQEEEGLKINWDC